jgi:hypothetical protein
MNNFPNYDENYAGNIIIINELNYLDFYQKYIQILRKYIDDYEIPSFNKISGKFVFNVSIATLSIIGQTIFFKNFTKITEKMTEKM